VEERHVNYNQKTGLFQVASDDGNNIYYALFGAGTQTDINGKCVTGDCKRADIQHADKDWLASMVMSDIDKMMAFMVKRETPLNLLNRIAGGGLAFWNNHWASAGGIGPPHGRGDWSAMVHDFNWDSHDQLGFAEGFNPFISKAKSRDFVRSNHILIQNADGVQRVKMGIVFGSQNVVQVLSHFWRRR
jgi:hypothetical protein